jgi:hypothetical protein
MSRATVDINAAMAGERRAREGALRAADQAANMAEVGARVHVRARVCVRVRASLFTVPAGAQGS